jgi:hypothetical protein
MRICCCLAEMVARYATSALTSVIAGLAKTSSWISWITALDLRATMWSSRLGLSGTSHAVGYGEQKDVVPVFR